LGLSFQATGKEGGLWGRIPEGLEKGWRPLNSRTPTFGGNGVEKASEPKAGQRKATAWGGPRLNRPNKQEQGFRTVENED